MKMIITWSLQNIKIREKVFRDKFAFVTEISVDRIYYVINILK